MLQGSILQPILFLIYVNDLLNGLKRECKLFANDTSLSSKGHDVNTSDSDINKDLEKKTTELFSEKMSFNPYPSKQAQKVIFIRAEWSNPSHNYEQGI